MVSALVAIEKLGLDVDVYYASEVNIHAIEVTEKNFPGRIIHLGIILDITEKFIASICPIYVFCGGSPCSNLSLINRRRTGLVGKL